MLVKKKVVEDAPVLQESIGFDAIYDEREQKGVPCYSDVLEQRMLHRTE